MREMEIMAKRNSSPSPGSFSGCTVTSVPGTITCFFILLVFQPFDILILSLTLFIVSNLILTANAPTSHDVANGGDDSPSSHDSGLGGNITGSCLGSSTSNNEERTIIVEGVNGTTRTDSSTPPSHMNNEIDPTLRGIEHNMIEDSQEIFKQIQSQRMNTSSPLSCPSSPLSSSSKLYSTVSQFNNGSMTDSASRSSMPVQNNHACQTVHTSDWPGNNSGKLFFQIFVFGITAFGNLEY